MVALLIVVIAVTYIGVVYMKSVANSPDLGIEFPKKKKSEDVNSVYRKENEVLRHENGILRQWASELLFSIEHLKEGEQALAVQEWRELNWAIHQELIENTPEARVGMLAAFNRSNEETPTDRARMLAEVENMIAARRMINEDFD